jgi:hypothetical protein
MIFDCVASQARLRRFLPPDFYDVPAVFQACAEFFEGCTMA